MKVICLVLLFVVGVFRTRAQFNHGPLIPCMNPNRSPGYCVPMKDCRPVLSIVLRQPLQKLDRDFIRASECISGFEGINTHVCCTTDTGYIRQKKQIPNNIDFVPYYSSAEEQGSYWGSSNSFFPFNDYDNFQPGWSQIASPELRSGPPQIIPSSSKNDVSRLSQPPTCGGVRLEKKIIGGEDADLFEFPWMVLLEYERKTPKDGNKIAQSCSGSLINQRYVLTAAHCVRGKIEKVVGKLVAVRLGVHDTSRKVNCNNYGACLPEAIRSGFEEVIPHELYTEDSKSQQNDVALIRLDRNIRFSESISPICLPTTLKRKFRSNEQNSNTEFTVAGWGHTSFSPESAVKQKLNISLYDQRKCKQRFGKKLIEVGDSQICAGGKFAKDSCSGDSGGPLMQFRDGLWVLEGIISFGYRCGLENWPGVYTRVQSFEDWIVSKMRK